MTLLIAELSLSVLLLSAGAAVLRQILSEACFQLQRSRAFNRRLRRQTTRPGDEIACMDRVLQHIDQLNYDARMQLDTGQLYTCDPACWLANGAQYETWFPCCMPGAVTAQL